MATCSTCDSWVSEDGKKGQCRRNPPNSTIIQTQNFAGQVVPAVLTFHPETAADHYCKSYSEYAVKLTAP